jgi:tetratricopeptide (TPR) repeat protein
MRGFRLGSPGLRFASSGLRHCVFLNLNGFDAERGNDGYIHYKQKAAAMKPLRTALEQEHVLYEAYRLSGQGKKEEALALLDDLHEEAPYWWMLHYNRGNILRELDRWEEAVEAYGRAWFWANSPSWKGRVSPEHLACIPTNQGVAYAAGKRFPQARQAFETALRINPDDDIAQDNLALLNRMDEILWEEQAVDVPSLRSIH